MLITLGRSMRYRTMQLRLIWLIAFTAIGFILFGQNIQLANQYFSDREFEKASVLFKQLYDKGKNKDYAFERYVDCLVYMDKYKEAEKEIQARLKKEPKKMTLYVRMGEIYELKLEPEKADKQYDLALQKLSNNRGDINKLANSFRKQTKYNKAIETYEKGMRLIGDSTVFAYPLADLYSLKGDQANMIKYYLLSAEGKPQRIPGLKNVFQRKLMKEDYALLQSQLYTKIQMYPDELNYPELLEWTFVQQKDYYNALRQARALDRKLGENGARVYNVGQIAMNDEDFETAITAFEYIIDNQGINTGYYVPAKQMLLEARRRQLYSGGQPDPDQLHLIEKEYLDFLDEFGKTSRTAIVIRELAKFKAKYMGDTDAAIGYLEELVSIPGVNKYLAGNAKLDLGDYYLLGGERWEATLLYSQVDKMFPDELLGEEARFRNAKLSYYVGDFEWAQEQFDILKSSTSKLISNDAIDLSVFIMDNIGLDTTDVPLKMYAHAELLVYQERYDDALAELEALDLAFPEHSLEDDLLYLKARTYFRQDRYDEAENTYKQVIEKYPDEIRGDNAMYELAQMYDYYLDRKEEAMNLYEELFINYTGSVFATESRKRYRVLRGDFEI